VTDGTTEASARALLRKSAPFVTPQRKRLTLVFALALATSALGACEPLIVKQLFDELGGARQRHVLLSVAALLLVAMIAHEALAGLLDTSIWRARIGVHYAITKQTIERLHALPLSYHRAETVGGIMTKMDRGINGAVAAFSDVAFGVVPAVLYLVISVIAMARLDGRLTLVVLAFVPVPPLIGAWASREQGSRERELMRRWTRIFSRVNEVLAGIVVVKSFTMEEVERRRFLRGVKQTNGIVLRGVRRDASVRASKNAVAALARAAAIGTGAYYAMDGELSIGTLVAFLAYANGMFVPVQGITGAYQTFRRGLVALETVFTILDATDTLGDAPDAIPAPRLRGEVEFRDLHFSYRIGAPVLDGVSLHVTPGETVALVGASGAGKTTLMALLQRFYDPTKGGVFLDGIDVRVLQQRSIREQIGVVLQDDVLFSESVRDNIAFGRASARQREIDRAARDANAHDFIMKLPEGYETVIGERGCALSAGQRQRIAIARALLKNPAILVLDEATSALDAESESAIHEALARLSLGRTTFIIAHRLSTVVAADRIVVMRGGQIVEMGTHAELVLYDGYYASLVARQTRGLLCDVDAA